LIGGTTGSGKSELLQSWILSLATLNSPQRVTFLLVDYKGGSAFSECRDLPHTVGLVTDLTPHLVRRALTSLRAEIRYRETLLHRKAAKDLVSLERTGDPETPPSLIIVVDEFAALTQEVPEFIDGVIDVAQRGRSLGLHLILGTQRPAGVIKGNLRANTNLRIALRVADAEDSMDVLGARDAAAFDASVPGRAMSRNGPSQLVPFQAAYVGGWTADVAPPPKIEISTFGFGAKSEWEDPAETSVESGDRGPTDIQRLVRSLDEANRIAHIPSPRLPWLPELAPVYDLTALHCTRDELVFGVADDPAHQQQPTVAFRPELDGSLAVFGTGNSGKSAFLRTIAFAAANSAREELCHVYGLDFGSRGLQMLEALPHVGSIVTGGDTERVGRLLTMLRELIDERATRFAKAGVGTLSAYRSANGSEEPRVFLLVDGMGAFRTAYEVPEHARLFDSFLSIAADGRSVGVHVVIAADRPNALPMALASQVQRRVVLRLADANDYSMFGLPADVIDRTSPPGRGLFGDLEIQVAVLGPSADPTQQAIEVERLAEAMRKDGIEAAPPVGRLSDSTSLGDLPVEVLGMPVFGLSGVTLGPVTFEPRGTFTVAGGPASGRTTTVATLVSAVRRWNPESPLYYLGNRRSRLVSAFPWSGSAVDVEGISTLASDLSRILEAKRDATSTPTVLVIEGILDFQNSPADAHLQELIKVAVDNGHFVVTKGDPAALGGPFPLLTRARMSRCGIVLQPDSGDGLLLRTQFPARLRRADFPPGRGLLVVRGGVPEMVQVAMS
jgi:S-DNA-T family DNA segregation ATPase FtsK/SpoIIIE